MQNLDTQLQRTLNMDDFDTAQEIRRRRKEIDEVVAIKLVSTTYKLLLPGEHCPQQFSLLLTHCQFSHAVVV